MFSITIAGKTEKMLKKLLRSPQENAQAIKMLLEQVLKAFYFYLFIGVWQFLFLYYVLLIVWEIIRILEVL